MYIGLLAIPANNWEAAKELLAIDRTRAIYDDEVHFAELKNKSQAKYNNQKTLLAKYWVQRVMYDEKKMFHFLLLGINMDRLVLEAFGPRELRKRNIYNRFFRSGINYALKSFFGPGTVRVSGVMHDIDELMHDDIFDWHAIWRLEQEEESISFSTDSILFIDSDHQKEQNYPEHSHFIQLCDVLLGGFRQCLDAPNKKDGCCEIGEMLLPLAERLTDPKRVNNPNSHYRYKNRISLKFFPSKKLSKENLDNRLARAQSLFYIERNLCLKDKFSPQEQLFQTGIE